MRRIGVIALLVLVVIGCRKEPENPYDSIDYAVVDNPSVDDLPEGNFAWLHGKVFQPTCANSGCHDGTFEPEFLTISSAYNSLVNHAVIANDAAFSFEYRVKPGDVDASLLHERMTVFIPNTSGVMPLSTEPESDWDALQDFYIGQIEDWIAAGAPDMYGQLPGAAGADLPPQVDGIAIFPSGNTTTPYTRDPDQAGVTAIQVEATTVDVWLRVLDDNTADFALTGTELRYWDDLVDFTDAHLATPLTYTSPITAENLNGQPSEFQFSATMDLTGVPPGTVYYLRSTWDDGNQPNLTVVPNDGSSSLITTVFSLHVQ